MIARACRAATCKEPLPYSNFKTSDTKSPFPNWIPKCARSWSIFSILVQERTLRLISTEHTHSLTLSPSQLSLSLALYSQSECLDVWLFRQASTSFFLSFFANQLLTNYILLCVNELKDSSSMSRIPYWNPWLCALGPRSLWSPFHSTPPKTSLHCNSTILCHPLSHHRRKCVRRPPTALRCFPLTVDKPPLPPEVVGPLRPSQCFLSCPILPGNFFFSYYSWFKLSLTQSKRSHSLFSLSSN